MQPRVYQTTALKEVRRYLDFLAETRKKASEIADPELAASYDFAKRAWDHLEKLKGYRPRKDGLGRNLPTFCMKVPTGGGKTFLAVKMIDLINMHYRRRRAGLVLWVVPTTQIYRQTIQNLRDKDHPYRQHLDMATGGHTLIREKSDRFTPEEVRDNLVVLMLMLPAANRETKETLRLFKDSGGFADFFPPEDDVKAQDALLKAFGNLDAYERTSGFWGRQAKTSLGNTLRMLSPLVILDEGHKAYSELAQRTLCGFNPCIVVELSATPLEGSNILVEVSGMDLWREDMIKLDLHLFNKASPDWKDTLLEARNRRDLLEEKAREYENRTGTNIRPICVIQVERTGKDQRGGKFIHSEDVREQLTKVMGVAPEEVAVKTSEKDELKEVDNVGGLMSRDCRIRYIITKQALQEGWDCAFAYVLAILTNPTSKNSLTQLVGRILRQPFARKTGVKELDESYVYCFQQRAKTIMDDIRAGFSREGLGDLRGRVSSEDELTGEQQGLLPHVAEIRDEFKAAAKRTILPVFVVREGNHWRRVSYEMDVAARVPWGEAELQPVMALTLSAFEEKDVETVATMSDDPHEVLRQKAVRQLREGAIPLDAVFMTRQISDVVPNPWQAHEFSKRVLADFRGRYDEKMVLNNFVFLIEELRRQLEKEKDRLSEGVFRRMLESGEMRFLVISEDLAFTFQKKMTVMSAKRFTRDDGAPAERTLFDYQADEDMNGMEKVVAGFLEQQRPLFFWYRNHVRGEHGYGIQGWRQHRIFPDFIFTTADEKHPGDYDRLFVVETKGLHLKDEDRTQYTRKLFDHCNREATSRQWTELSLQMKDKVLRFEVLAEDEWKKRLIDMLHA